MKVHIKSLHYFELEAENDAERIILDHYVKGSLSVAGGGYEVDNRVGARTFGVEVSPKQIKGTL